MPQLDVGVLGDAPQRVPALVRISRRPPGCTDGLIDNGVRPHCLLELEIPSFQAQHLVRESSKAGGKLLRHVRFDVNVASVRGVRRYFSHLMPSNPAPSQSSEPARAAARGARGASRRRHPSPSVARARGDALREPARTGAAVFGVVPGEKGQQVRHRRSGVRRVPQEGALLDLVLVRAPLPGVGEVPPSSRSEMIFWTARADLLRTR